MQPDIPNRIITIQDLPDPKSYMEQLDDSLLVGYYRLMKDALNNLDTSFQYPTTELIPLNPDIIPSLLQNAIQMATMTVDGYSPVDHADLSEESTDEALIIDIIYTRPKDEILAIRKKIDEITDRLVDAASGFASQFDKFKFFHNWLVLNVKPSANPTTLEEILATTDARTPKGVFLDGLACCSGLSIAMRILCEKAGVYCLSLPAIATDNMGLDDLSVRIARDAGVSETSAANIAGMPRHAVCFIVADGMPFYYDPMCVLETVQLFGNYPECREFGTELSLKTLNRLGIFPRGGEKLVPELTDNEISKTFELYCQLGKLNETAALGFISDLANSGGRNAFFYLESKDDADRFANYISRPEVKSFMKRNDFITSLSSEIYDFRHAFLGVVRIATIQ